MAFTKNTLAELVPQEQLSPMDIEDTSTRRRRELLSAALAVIAERGLEGLQSFNAARVRA